MKKSKIIAFLALLALICSVYTFAQDNKTPQNQDIGRIKEDDEEFKKQREVWIENMHQAEPGVNWRIIEHENNIAKHYLKQSKLESNENQKDNDIQRTSEKVGGGYLQGKWIERGSNNQAGRIHTSDIDYSRNLIYSASAGGNIWRGTIDGKNWTCLNNSFKIRNIRMIKVIKIGAKNRIIVAANSPAACYYSDNEGNTWNKSIGFDEPAKWGGVQQAVVLNNFDKTIYALCNEWDYNKWKSVSAIYFSNDKGISFIPLYKTFQDLGLMDIWAETNVTNKVFLLHKDTLSEIDKDKGVTNIAHMIISQPWTDIDRLYIRGCNSPQGMNFGAYVHSGNGNFSYIYASSDNGANWEERGKLTFSAFDHNSFNMSSYSSDYMFLGGVDLYRTVDGGRNWEAVNSWGEYYSKPQTKLHADIPGVNIFRDLSEGETMLIGTDGGLFISNDWTQNVNNISMSGLNVSQYYSIYTNKNDLNKVYIGSQDQGLQRCIYKQDSTLFNFEQVISGDYGHLESSDKGSSLWSVYPGFAQLYTSFDQSNTYRYSWDFLGKGGLWMPPLEADPENPRAAYVACGGNDGTQNIWNLKVEGNGLNATMMAFDFNSDKTGNVISEIKFSTLNNNYFYAISNNGKFFYSANKGQSFIQTPGFTGPGGHYFYGSSIIPSSKKLGNIFIAGSGYSNPGAYKSTNNGQSFTPIDSGLPKTLVYGLAATPDDKYLFAATETGPYVYVADKDRWYDMTGNDSPDQLFWCVEYIPEIKTVRFGTYGRGIWDFAIEQFTDPTDVQDIEIVKNISISANPNPVKDETNIVLDIINQAYGTVKIYDLQGRVVDQLFDGLLNSRRNEIRWKPSANLPNGNYMCIVTSVGKTAFAKLRIDR